MKGICISLAVFLTAFQFQSASLAEEISGIGVKLAEKNGQVVLEMVYPETPADQAGLRSGEVILLIDGKSIKGKTLQGVTKLLLGPAGSKVKLLIQDNEGNKRTAEVTRKTFSVSATGPSDFIGEFVASDKPEMKIVVKKANEQKWQIFCENENWSGAGLIYQNPTFKSYHYKGVFRMDDSPNVEEAMRGVGGFFRINYLANGALELKRQWGLDGDKGDKSTTLILTRSNDK
jgi:hypothetical protein